MARGPVFKSLLVTLIASLAAGLLAETPADYANLPGHKAMAAVPGYTASIYGIGHSRPTDIDAANWALQQCQRKLARQTGLTLAPWQTCEVLNLNQERITTGAEIRALVPDSPHPLYLWRYTSDTATDGIWIRGVPTRPVQFRALRPGLPLPSSLFCTSSRNSRS